MARTIGSTYRVQVHAGFTLHDALQIVPYLDQLGIDAMYLSPVTTARAGSTHGYDVVDPLAVGGEIGGEAALVALADALHARGMHLVVDIVPNHMAASPENPWWRDVLENGPGSPFATWFDIDWHPAALKAGLRGKLLVPILGGPYGEVLENGQLKLVIEPEGLVLKYWETRLPLAPRSYPAVLRPVHESLAAEWGDGHPLVTRLAAVIADAERLPPRSNPDEPPSHSWLRERARVKHDLVTLFAEHADLRERAQRALDERGGRPGDPTSFDALDRILDAQNFWLAFWRLASQEINYRRFFNITDLVAVRVEDAAVMDATHELLIRLARSHVVDGFRVDHIDGLANPAQYLRRLQQRLGAAPFGPPRRRRPGFFVVVEKILARDEPLPTGWAASGTTGYEFGAVAGELFVDSRGLAELDAIYRRHTALTASFADVRYEQKKRVVERLFGGEVRSLASRLGRIAALDRYARDIPQAELTLALIEVTACLPIYRTYTDSAGVSDRDRPYVLEALDQARRRTPEDAVSDGAFRFVRRVLLDEPMRGLAGVSRARLQFVMHWQQFTGAAMAKGLEDSTFYIYNRLVSQNEVGGDPGLDDAQDSVSRFHRFCSARALHWPGALNATSTHDTKRSEDVRARIDVLSEIPEAWGRALERWSALNAPHRTVVHGRPVPGPNQEVLLYQSLVGAWPFDERDRGARFVERFTAYMVKAAREAAVRTSWMAPDEEHEQALSAFIAAILDPSRAAAFLDDFNAFHAGIVVAGAMNALGQVLLKTTAPGVPDFYQGSELWDFSLVDPDNRRPVDYDRRQSILASLRNGDALDAELASGALKLYVTRCALHFRRAHAALFDDGDYLPLQVSGPRAAHVVAFARRHGTEWAVVIVARWLHRMQGDAPRMPEGAWGSTLLTLPAGAPDEWNDVLTPGEPFRLDDRTSIDVARVLRRLPIALLCG